MTDCLQSKFSEICKIGSLSQDNSNHCLFRKQYELRFEQFFPTNFQNWYKKLACRINYVIPLHLISNAIFEFKHVCFWGVFAKLQKVTIIFVTSVCLSICPSVRPPARPATWNNSAPNGRIFIKFHIVAFFENLSRNLSFIKTRQE
jgi:hypothetical protein